MAGRPILAKTPKMPNRKAIPETCPSGEEPPEAKPAGGKTRPRESRTFNMSPNPGPSLVSPPLTNRISNHASQIPLPPHPHVPGCIPPNHIDRHEHVPIRQQLTNTGVPQPRAQ
jgi:hypothetical protein